MKSKRVVLTFPPQLVEEPITFQLVKKFDMEFNLLKGYIKPNEEGLLVLELKGDDDNFQRAVEYLHRTGVDVQPLKKDIVRDEDRCVHCGLCVGICPAQAFWVEADHTIAFDEEKCIAFGLCIAGCPLQAVQQYF